MVREALGKSREYKDVVEELTTLREKKRTIENCVNGEFSRELDMLDDLTATLKQDQDRISDMVISSLSNGEIIKVRDSRNATYDPIVKVVFRKSDEQEGT